MQKNLRKQEALDYHSKGRPGKIEVIPTKATKTQRDLSLAYSPGVAVPCLEIHENPETVYQYTAKGNLVVLSAMAQLFWAWAILAPGRQTGNGRQRCVV